MDAPSGERSCSFAYIIFAVVTLAEGKELKPLTREVFIGVSSPVPMVVEVDQNRWVTDHIFKEIEVVPPEPFTERKELLEQKFWMTDNPGFGGEVVVPEEEEVTVEAVLWIDELLAHPAPYLFNSTISKSSESTASKFFSP